MMMMAAERSSLQLIPLLRGAWVWMDAHVSDSVDSAGAIGVGADADGLWAANSVGAGTPAEFPLTQAYDDDGLRCGVG